MKRGIGWYWAGLLIGASGIALMLAATPDNPNPSAWVVPGIGLLGVVVAYICFCMGMRANSGHGSRRDDR